ncbi:hypothetical protein G6M89_13580 [Natronolimnobius sp. AArcel1]|uniref:HalOD1 output domain-containing protein n=1 Tax=Natronolimnobius sp. AArcel1 TaxID=1679093 RepID=UPI0013ED1BAD|nr:HalOD1 output domain-containing protein [Natronolimnobius sp. AArcel1]NGM70023.1 hypothetical protein [Natronolimnobius sp. AArcel1]
MNQTATGLESITGTSDPQLSVAVITAVADRQERDPIDLPPLYDAINPDALDAVFESTRANGERRGHLSFTYAGHEIYIECGEQTRLIIDGTVVGGAQATIGADLPAGP